MTRLRFISLLAAIFPIFFSTAAEDQAAPLHMLIPPAKPAEPAHFNMGTGRRPDGVELDFDNRSLRLAGRRWMPAMGEFHFARYPESEWREELLKLKAGGIEIVATYVFWIHHEEVEGQFDWSGRRDLRQFIQLCGDVGLKAIVRCGPWCHGEVRNGGSPDWVLKQGWKIRSEDERYLAKVQMLYGEIAKQLRGQLWKDGGPVIGIQLDNEFHGPAQYLLALKRIARAAGLDVPLYTRTGWPELTSAMPFGEIVPLYGVYAEGFWDRALTPMPNRYWAGFHFSSLRVDTAIATELLGQRVARDISDAEKYPFLTCEIGGGMMNSYHRRILVDPADIESTTLVKLGSGSASPGYYMYHGGVNPEAKLTTLQESQASGMWNDLPEKSYDFQAPLGEYGQIRPHYHQLRRLHLFLQDWGAALADMPPVMPEVRPTGSNDYTTLRWCARSDGQAGFIFVNNYQRGVELPPKTQVQFALQLSGGAIQFPKQPVTVPAGARFIWPFNLDLGNNLRLAWATAQPVCAIDDGNTRTIFFAETEGIPAQFAVAGAPEIQHLRPGHNAGLELAATNGGSVRIVLLTAADSLALWKGNWQGRERVFLTAAGLVTDGDALRLTSSQRAELAVSVLPAPASIAFSGAKLTPQPDGVFQHFSPPVPKAMAGKPVLEKIQPAGPARDIPLGKIKTPVAAAPEDADFKSAAIWRIRIPADVDLAGDPILRVHYIGDAARFTVNDRFITDDFYNGNAFDLGLRRHAPAAIQGDLRVAILPLRKDAPVYLAKEARPDFKDTGSIVALESVELIPRYQVQLERGE